MHVRCPHCHSPVEILDDSSFKDILCSACGSKFSLVGGTDATETAHFSTKTLGQFELVEQLGVGAFGTVWKAKDTQLDRLVAIKIPRKGQLSDAETEQFLREARAAAQLRHANIVSVHEVGKSDDSVYIVSDYVEGADLKEWMRGQPLPPKEAAELCAAIAEALHHAHEQGVIHRDLKPGNIMMDLGGQPHIMDFGLAKRESGEMTMTVDGAILGTPAYMSPEQAKGKGHQADRRSDVYSLGTMLFEMLTGELPFRGEKRMLIVSVLTEEPPKLRRLSPRVPKDVETICLKCLEKDLERRYATAKELANDLRRFLIGEPIGARPVGGVEYAWRWSRRHPAGAGLIAASLIGLVLMAGLLAGLAFQQRLTTANQRLAEINLKLGEAQTDLQRAIYFRRVSQALSAWNNGQVGRAERLLRECPNRWRHWEWFYVDHLVHADVATLEGHAGWVHGVTFSPDGARIISASTDNTVRVWDAHEYRQLSVLNGEPDIFKLADHGDGIYYGFLCVAVSSDGKRIAAGSGNQRDFNAVRHNVVKIWEADTGQEVRSLSGHRGAVSSVAFSPDCKQIVSGSWDNTAKVWDAETGRVRYTLNGHSGWVNTVKFSADGQWIATSSGTTVRLWRAEDGREVRVFGEVAQVNSWAVAFSPNGRTLASGDRGAIRFWNMESRQELVAIDGHEALVFGLAFNGDGAQVASASGDKTVKIWNVPAGQELSTMQGHKDFVMDVDFSPDNRRIVSGSRDGTIKIWDLSSRAKDDAFAGQSNSSSVDSSSVDSSSVDSRAPGGIAFSPDGTRVVGGSAADTVTVWDAATGRVLLTLRGHTDLVRSVTFSPNGTRIASASDDRTVRVWDAGTGAALFALEGHDGGVLSVAYSPDGERIVTGAGGGGRAADRFADVKVWDAVSGRELLTLKGHTWAVNSVAFSPDGDHIASASHDHSVKIWDANTGEAIEDLTDHTYAVKAVVYGPDGRIASGSWDRTVKIWDQTSRTVRLSLDASDWINSVAFSPDGDRVIGACRDGTVRVWDTDDGAESLALNAGSGRVQSVAFSQDGRRIASRSKDGTIKVWDAGTTEFIRDTD